MSNTQEWEDKPGDGLTNEEILTQLQDFARVGVIQYVLPTEPLGQEWVIGLEGLGICKLVRKSEAIAFISGANAVVRLLERKQYPAGRSQS